MTASVDEINVIQSQLKVNTCALPCKVELSGIFSSKVEQVEGVLAFASLISTTFHFLCLIYQITQDYMWQLLYPPQLLVSLILSRASHKGCTGYTCAWHKSRQGVGKNMAKLQPLLPSQSTHLESGLFTSGQFTS